MSYLWFALVIILFYSAVKVPKKHIPTEVKQKSDDQFFKNTWKSGQHEEVKMFYELRKISGYTRFLKNVRMPMEDKSVSIVDFMMISQKGIYLFDGKDITGSIYGDEINKYWRFVSFDGEKNRLANPIWRMKAYLNVLKRVLGVYEPLIYRIIIVFGERSSIQKMNIHTPLIRVVHQKELLLKVREEMLQTKNIFTPQHIDKIYEKLQKFADQTVQPTEVEQEETAGRNGLVLIKGKKE